MSEAVAVSAPTAPAAVVTGDATAPSTAPDAPGVSAEEPAQPSGSAATPAAPQAADPAPAQPTAPQVDEVAEALARLNRAEREAVKQKKKLDLDREQFTGKLTLAEKAEKARQAIASKDYLAALAAIADGELNADEVAVLTMEQANARDPKPMTEADIARIAEEKIRAKEAEAAAAAEAKRAKDLEDGKAMYGNACMAAYKASPEKYQLVGALGVKGDEIIAYAVEQAQKTGSAPDPEAALEHFEKRIEAALTKAGYSKAQIQAAKDGKQPDKPTPTAPIPDVRATAQDPKKAEKVETMAEMEARHKAEFRALRQQSRA